jgi:hypothetical protein
MSLFSEREDKAVEALITGALHPFFMEITEDDIERFLNAGFVLSPEGVAALAKYGNNPLAQTSSPIEHCPVFEAAGDYAAMHRALDADEMDEETKAELERQREEILKRIRERRNR